MADQVTPFGTLTTNYGWTKPTVGADADIWGNAINVDLDNIDSTVKAISNSVPAAAVIVPVMDGAAAVGTSSAFARQDHVHPTDTSRASVASVAALPVAMNDNRIINGGFAINQRAYVSGTALPATPVTAAYGHDRWKAGAAGGTYTFTAVLPDTTITVTAGTLTQIIEAGVIEGGVYSLSWTGTAQARVYQGSPTGAYAASPVITPSLTAGTNTTVEFNAGTVTRVKLEIGSVATPYNRQSLAKSMADCQRYYCNLATISLSAGPPATAAGQQTYTFITLPTTMRAAPTVSVPTVSSTNCSAAGALNPAPTGFNLYISALAAGVFYGALGPITASAEL